MHFGHSLVGVEIAVALVNTGIGEEELKGVAELREFAKSTYCLEHRSAMLI